MLQTRSNVYLVAQVNTVAGGDIVSISNSAGWVIAQSNTAGMTVNIINSAGWLVGVGSTSIVNSAGWVVSIANTIGLVVASGSTNIINSAGWIVNVANTGGVVYSLDSAATGAVVSVIASTIGTVVLAVAQVKRVALSIYNASVNPLYMKMGSGAKTTDFTLMMVASGYYEMARPIYNGQFTGVWGIADGNALVTETT